MYLAVSERSKL